MSAFYAASAAAAAASWAPLVSFGCVAPSAAVEQPAVAHVAFDPYHDLLWSTLSDGQVVSFAAPRLERYSAFRVCPKPPRRARDAPPPAAVPSAVASFSLGEILACVTSDSVGLYSHGGVRVGEFRDDSLADVQSAAVADEASGVLLVATASDLLEIDVSQEGTVEFPTDDLDDLCVVHCDHLAAVGTVTGSVHLFDTRTVALTASIRRCHGGPISSIATSRDLLVTTGWSGETPDALIKIYDLRFMRDDRPLNVLRSTGAIEAVMHPVLGVSLFVLCDDSSVQVYDCNVGGPPSMVLPVMAAGNVETLALSASGNVLTVADSACVLHVFADRDDAPLNMPPCSVDTDDIESLATVASAPPLWDDSFDWDTTAPFNDSIVPEMLLHDRMASRFPKGFTFVTGRPRPPLSRNLVESAERFDFLLKAPNPRLRHRNQVEATPAYELRTHNRQHSKANAVPEKYRRVTNHLERGFDFRTLNRSRLGTLEPLAQGFANAVLYALHSIVPLRNMLEQHLCKQDPCIACELGHVFRMLDASDGAPVHAGNLIRAFRQVPLAPDSLLGINPDTTPNTILDFLSFLARQIDHELGPSGPFYGWMSTSFNSSTQCQKCRRADDSMRRVTVLDMPLHLEQTFCQTLLRSMSRVDEVRAWCPVCREYTVQTSRQNVAGLPSTLLVAFSVRDAADVATWRATDAKSPDRPAFLPEYVSIAQSPSGMVVAPSTASEFAAATRNPQPNASVYRVSSILSHVNDQVGHAVCHTAVPPVDWHKAVPALATPPRDRSSPLWLLRNSVAVAESSAADALNFASNYYRVPLVVVLQTDRVYSASLVHPLSIVDERVFNVDARRVDIKPMNTHELRVPGMMVALDAEFVALTKAADEMLLDGTVMTQPNRLAPARVSVLRASGPLKDTVLMNDYILPFEPIADYMTRYSGIQPDDLDPHVSQHSLQSLKTVHLKLRALVDNGCVFVGHGLDQDFRMLNIFVPARQVIDTSELFRIPNQRKLSLRFLTSALLRVQIQEEEHDSIEDARAALHLYDIYLQFKQLGVVETLLAKLYELGRVCSFISLEPADMDDEFLALVAGIEVPTRGASSSGMRSAVPLHRQQPVHSTPLPFHPPGPLPMGRSGPPHAQHMPLQPSPHQHQHQPHQPHPSAMPPPHHHAASFAPRAAMLHAPAYAAQPPPPPPPPQMMHPHAPIGPPRTVGPHQHAMMPPGPPPGPFGMPTRSPFGLPAAAPAAFAPDSAAFMPAVPFVPSGAPRFVPSSAPNPLPPPLAAPPPPSAAPPLPSAATHAQFVQRAPGPRP